MSVSEIRVPDTLINITCHPLNLPPMFSSYIMNRKHFTDRYLKLFSLNETIKCDFGLEIYLPDCFVELSTDKDKINGFRELFSSNKHGNFDILNNLEKLLGNLKHKKQRLDVLTS